MTYFTDLSRCTYFGDDIADSLVSVGWLSGTNEFARGNTPAEAYSKLTELFLDPWQPKVTCGTQHCELCQFDLPSGNVTLFVPDGSRIFVCPELMMHDMANHDYQSPLVCLDAVLNCPPTRSMEYKRLLLDSGGRSLIRDAG